MAEYSAIAWCDHTMNFWIGCTEVGPGCDLCYARELDGRYQWGVPADQRIEGEAPHWGDDKPRHRTAASNWKQPYKWDRQAAAQGRPFKVFASSLSDFFDNKVDAAWRADAWKIIRETPNLRWIILTKRVSNIAKMLPPDWGDGWPNVGFMVSVVNQQEFDRDAPRLLKIPARWHGFSMEPQIGPIILPGWLLSHPGSIWMITGGESAQPTSGLAPRPYDVMWPQGILAADRLSSNLYAFVKQLGANPVGLDRQLKDSQAGEDIDEWPPILKVRRFPPELLA